MRKLIYSESPEFHFCTRHACEHGWESECKEFERQGRPCPSHAKADRTRRKNSISIRHHQHDEEIDQEDQEDAGKKLLEEIFGNY